MDYYRREFYCNGIFQGEIFGSNKKRLMKGLKDYCVECGKVYAFKLFLETENSPIFLFQLRYCVSTTGKIVGRKWYPNE